MAQRLLSTVWWCVGAILVGCSGQPSALEVCKKLEAAGIAENCREGQKYGASAIAKEKAEFDLPKIPTNRPSEVLTFNQDREFLNTVKTYNEFGTHNGMHRYGNSNRRVFVAIHEDAPAELADKAEKIVDGL
jgi:hypothetical protein